MQIFNLLSRWTVYGADDDGDVATDKVLEAISIGTKYHVILMDYQMPRVDGREALTQIPICDSFTMGVTGRI